MGKSVFSAVAASLITAALLWFAGRLGQINILVPAKAVIAFNMNGCPDGWTLFTQAQGRMIVGAGEGSALTRRTLGESGGEERHVLAPSELPSHSHLMGIGASDSTTMTTGGQRRLVSLYDDVFNKAPAATSSSIGGGQPHENMPPFHVLVYCEKQ